MSAEDFEKVRARLPHDRWCLVHTSKECDCGVDKVHFSLERIEARMAELGADLDRANDQNWLRAYLDVQNNMKLCQSDRNAAEAEVERLRGYVEKLKLDISGHVGVIHLQHDHIERLRAAIREHEEDVKGNAGFQAHRKLWAALRRK